MTTVLTPEMAEVIRAAIAWRNGPDLQQIGTDEIGMALADAVDALPDSTVGPQAAVPCVRCAGLTLELAATQQMLDVMTAPAESAGPCPRIAHESGVVLACTVDHGEPRSGLHANSHHRALWTEDDDRIVSDGAS